MTLKRWLLPFAFISLTVGSSLQLQRLASLPFPHFNQLILKFSGLQDVVMIATGFRRVAADLAWIDLLQYTGGGYRGDPKKGIPAEYAFETIKERTLRVTRVDPFYQRAYLYGGTILAWFRNVARPQEAVEVLTEGAHFNPTYWPIHTTLAAIAYKQSDQVERMAVLLEQAVQDPRCPSVMKTVLANTYKKMGRYEEALKIWVYLEAYDPSPSVRHEASEEIPQILELRRAANR